MLRNSKYYVKTLSKSDASGCKSIKSMFEKSKIDQQADLSTISSENEQSCSHDHLPGESETSISMAKEHEGMSEVVTLST